MPSTTRRYRVRVLTSSDNDFGLLRQSHASIIRGLEGSYLSASGELIPERINLLYCDAPLALSKDSFQEAREVRRGTTRR
jgi:hypothetical protein